MMLPRSFSSILARSVPNSAASAAAAFSSFASSSSFSPPWSPLARITTSTPKSQRKPTPPSSAIGMTPTTALVVRHRSNRSSRGLYDGRDVRFGNNVPFSMKKTRRRWNPNMQYKRVYSEVLDEMVPFHLTTSALRTIDKMGGLDEYLLRSKHVTTKGEGEGQRIRNRIIQKMTHREGLKKKAFDNGESVDDWDKIVLVGKKIRQQQPVTLSLPSEALSVMEES